MTSTSSLAPEIIPAETYQIDSDEYDSDQERDDLEDEEYDQIVIEAENGYSEEEMKRFTKQLKECGLVNFLRDYLGPGQEGEMRSLRKLLLGFGIIPPNPLRNISTPNLLLLPFAKIALSRILRRRERLSNVSTLEDALRLIRDSKKIIILSGAGISTSCGIPDFRSSTGLYSKLQEEGKYNLDDPQQMFDIHYFKENPQVFYSFAKQIYPSNFIPSPCHRWIKMLEDKGKLLRNYTQNIDTLESLAGVEKVLQCHGSFKTASCLRCKTRVPGQTIEPHIMSQQVPYCGSCRTKRDEEINRKKEMKKGKGKAKAKAQWDDNDDDDSEEDEWGGGEPGIIKPDITFFGQALDSEFDQCLFQDREEVDLLVIIGTSLKVAPVSEVLTHIPHSVPQIYINLTPVYHVQPDICLLGDADSIVNDLSSQLGWDIPPPIAITNGISNLSSTSTSDPDSSGHGKNGRGDEARIPIPVGVSISPEEGEWMSGQGEASHIHLFRKKGYDPMDQTESNDSSQISSTSTPSGLKQEKYQSQSNIDKVDIGDAHDGYESDNDDSPNESDNDNDDRPVKRSRAE
ncbi:uncharacterized protein IL334_001533 [Kwoniella shivajii]|uniref:Deacetylase sirtuin-type domain-containing protein n=1 Tax=Kwoniella shivajii TaxID=564305 RepID=A0ABZ1CS86_9TREE|nr:hypothetical protein IL334_001533 [Kwoniella shivajii]